MPNRDECRFNQTCKEPQKVCNICGDFELTEAKAKVNVEPLVMQKITDIIKDYESVQKSMNEVADVIDASHLMPPFRTKKFRKIPKGDDYFKPADYANKLLSSWYDYADEYRVWTE